MSLLNLSEGAAGTSAPREESCDVSAFYDTPTVVVWREPDVPTVYRFEEDAYRFKQANVEWSDAQCFEVAKMALCHVSPQPPGAMSVGVMYQTLANDPKFRRLYLYLVVHFRAAFPELFLTGAELKKILLPVCVPSASALNGSETDTPSN